MRIASQYVVLNPCMLPSGDNHRRPFSGPEETCGPAFEAYLPQDKGCCEGSGQPRREGSSAGPEGAAAGEEFCLWTQQTAPRQGPSSCWCVNSTHALQHVAEPWGALHSCVLALHSEAGLHPALRNPFAWFLPRSPASPVAALLSFLHAFWAKKKDVSLCE